MDREELKAWLRLSLSPGIGNVTARKLLACFGLPQAIFEQPTTALRQVATPLQTQALRAEPPALSELLDTTWAWLDQSEAQGCRRQVLSLGDPGYPQALLDIDDPPLLLYLYGVASFQDSMTTALMAVAVWSCQTCNMSQAHLPNFEKAGSSDATQDWAGWWLSIFGPSML